MKVYSRRNIGNRMVTDKMETRYGFFVAGLALLAALLLAGCAAAPSDNARIADARASLAHFIDQDPGLQPWVDNAFGYAVFPSVGKGGFWVGGSYGRGIVFERAEPIGRTRIIQGTVGAQIGAQNFAQVIFFEDEVALRNFQRGNFEFSAQATAIVVKAGAAATTSYDGGVAVFIMTKSGLRVEASVGGQKFEYQAF
jgi:lipid-binding SYLF domain-containing protein